MSTTRKINQMITNPRSKSKKSIVFTNSKFKKPVRKPQNKRRRQFLPKRGVRRPIASRLGNMTATGKNWLMCRLDPFMGGSSNGLPDGNASRVVVIDHRTIDTFTFGANGTFYIAITPAIPSVIWWSAGNDAAAKVNGLPYAGGMGYMKPIQLKEWARCPVVMNNVAGNYNTSTPLYNATRLRVSTVGWRIRYIGSSMNNSGVMKINSYSLSTNSPFPNPVNFTVTDSQGAGIEVFSPNQVMLVRQGDFLNFDGTNSAETRIIPLMYGAQGVLRHNSPDYEFINVSCNQTFLIDDQNEGVCNLDSTSTNTNMSLTSYWPQVSAFDSNWSPTTIEVTGGSPGSAFVLEAIYCVEYVPSANSSTFAIAKQSPPKDTVAINRSAELAKSAPIAGPLETLKAVGTTLLETAVTGVTKAFI